MTTFNPGDRVYHRAGGLREGLGTVTRTLSDAITGVIWDEGTVLGRMMGPLEREHGTLYLVLVEPAFSEYDPTQVGDTEDDI
jgi:hypothetical protein